MSVDLKDLKLTYEVYPKFDTIDIILSIRGEYSEVEESYPYEEITRVEIDRKILCDFIDGTYTNESSNT